MNQTAEQNAQVIRDVNTSTNGRIDDLNQTVGGNTQIISDVNKTTQQNASYITDVNNTAQANTAHITDVNTTLGNRIGINENNISTNKGLIDTNTRDITHNRTDIDSNIHRIGVVEDKLQYVNVQGDRMSIGRGARVQAADAIALGNNAHVEKGATGSVALGEGAVVRAGVTNAVALGKGSVASESNTISVGSATNQRRITNVADGINPHDAVNMRQYNFLQSRVNHLQTQLNGVGAMSAAMSALVPNPRSHKQRQISVGMGHYKSSTAIAVGAFYYVNDDLLINAAASYSSDSGTSFRAGVTWGF